MKQMLFVAALAATPALAAQQSVPARLSLADAIALARTNNPGYRQILNDRYPAAWGVRNAFSSLLLPSVNASGGVGYSGSGSQTFGGANFDQNVATMSSSYDVSATWQLSGATLSQPGLARAELRAAEADIDGAARLLNTGVTQQYLSVLQAQENAAVAARQVESNNESLKLAQARYAVGQATLIDVRQAQVAHGQAEVVRLQAANLVSIEKLRLFEQMGVSAPVDIATVQLTDSFAVQAPRWELPQLLQMAEQQNPSLQALRARERAASWGVKAATSSYGPSLSFQLGWGGFARQFTDLAPIIQGDSVSAGFQLQACQDNNQIRASAGLGPDDPVYTCAQRYDWSLIGAQRTAAIRSANALYPFDFTTQPFQAGLRVSLPLFTNFSRVQRVSQARATHNDLEEGVRQRGLAVQTEVSQAFLTLQTLHQSIAIQETNRTAAREQLQLATERYRVGSGTFFVLVDAQVTAQRAEVGYVNAIYDYHKALATLESAVGQTLR